MLFQHVQLFTSDLAKQLEFYRDRLGLSVLEQSRTSVTLEIGLSKLEFLQGNEAFYHFAFNIPAHQFTEAITWLSGRVKRIADSSGQEVFYSKGWNADMAYFYDAGGNIVEFIARHDLECDRQGLFFSGSLECISELGIVTDSVSQTVKLIQTLTDASLYRAEVNESFVPLGDETGLFIIVKRGRIWFPETKAARPSPFKAMVTRVGGNILEISQESLGLA